MVTHYRQGSGHAEHRLSPTRNIHSAQLNARTGLGLSLERRLISARYLPHLGHHIETKSPPAFRYGTTIPETDDSHLAISNHTRLDCPRQRHRAFTHRSFSYANIGATSARWSSVSRNAMRGCNCSNVTTPPLP